MADRFYTLMLVPEKSGQVKKLTLPALYLRVALGIGASLVVIGAIFFFDYLHVLSQVAENKKLRAENHQIRQNLLEARGKLESLDQSMGRLKSFAHKLRILGNLDTNAQKLIAPPEDAPVENNLSPVEDGGNIEEPSGQIPSSLKKGKKGAKVNPHDLLEEKRHQAMSAESSPMAEELQDQVQEIIQNAEALNLEAVEEERNFASLFEVLQEKVDRLLSTPSILPAQGWLTSTFGYRSNPFVGVKTFHAGLDIANRPGTPIHAPAEGLITHATSLGGFGLVVRIDHGYNLITKFGHLSKVLVKPGQRVKRGQAIALMGNSGRSTGTHVHYQIEVAGKPVNPRNFILEDTF